MLITLGRPLIASGPVPFREGDLWPRAAELCRRDRKFLKTRNLPYVKYSREQLPEVVAQPLAEGKTIGLHQGRMEFGPRALGERTIIGDPRSPSMQSIMNLKIKYLKRSDVPAVTHVDYSARIQTVRRELNPIYWAIIDVFHRLLIVNTSFNVRGEPIVCTPEDSYRCFMRTEVDYLVLETWVLDKRDQPPFAESEDWRTEFGQD